VRAQTLSDKQAVHMHNHFRTALKGALDFALPPRCPGCATIIEQPHVFCPECWSQIQFLGDSGCEICGLSLEATDAGTCAACLAKPPRIQRTRAAVAYDDLTRGLAIRLKYGRKVALARTMSRYMAPLLATDGPRSLIVPVPLHRSRLWVRGFNQAAMIGRELSRLTGIRNAPLALTRIKRTPSLRGLSGHQRRRTVAGAFRADPSQVEGMTVFLVDDVLTTGSTAESCARALQRAGAARVELISWARVVRPVDIMR
jgi:ComF family protein